MVEMLYSPVKMVLVALFSFMLLVQVGSAEHKDTLTDTLRANLKNNKDVAPLLLVKFLSELIAARGDAMLSEPEEEEGVREQVMRRHLPLSQRERKAGCRNFFWKTFTSC